MFLSVNLTPMAFITWMISTMGTTTFSSPMCSPKVPLYATLNYSVSSPLRPVSWICASVFCSK